MSIYQDAERRNRRLHDYTEKLKSRNLKDGRHACEGCLAADIAPCDQEGNCNFDGYVSEIYGLVFGKK